MMKKKSRLIPYKTDTCEPLKNAVGKNTLKLSAISQGTYPGRHDIPSGLSELLSVGYWDAPRKQDWQSDWHRNEGIKIVFLSRGNISFGINDSTIPMRRGDLCITRPWQVHRFGVPFVPASRLLWLILDLKVTRPNQTWVWPDWFFFLPEELDRLSNLMQHNEQPVWRASPSLIKSFQHLEELTELQSIEMLETRLKLTINTLFLELLDMMDKQDVKIDKYLSTTKRTVEVALQQIRRESSEPWTLDSMSEAAGLGRTRFGYYCRLVSGMSPLEFLNFCRVEKAKELLQLDTEMTITDIAMEAGFGSSQYFSTVFKLITSCSPKEFRRDKGLAS